MTAPIAGLEYGTVSWKAMLAVADGVDTDAVPDIIPVSNGSVTFTPSASSLLVAGANPPVTILGQPVVCQMENGILRDAEGRSVISLLADTAAVNPQGWTWRMDYLLNDGKIKGGFSFHLSPNEHVDLTTATPVGSSNGVLITRGEKGDPGQNGIGLALSEVDAEMANKVNTVGSQVDVALRAIYATDTELANGIAGKQDVIALDADVAAKINTNGTAVSNALNAKYGALDGATTTTRGVVKLAGDLAGTADLPTVPGLAAKADDAALHKVAKTGVYSDLTGRPAFATVATSGNYADLANKPVIPAAYTDEQVRDVVGATLAAGANITISVNDATDTITIAAGDVNATVADGSITEAKLAFDTATQAELDAAVAPVVAATNLATASALVKRDTAGGADFKKVYISDAPTGDSQATRKDYVDNALAGKVSSGTVTNMTVLTQAAYDAITTKSATTLYIIQG